MDRAEDIIDVLVFFALPFPLHLKDSLLDKSRGGSPGSLAEEIIVNGTPPTGVRTILRLNPAAPIQSPLEVEGGDPFGRFMYSEIQVRFNAAVSPEVMKESHDLIVTKAVQVANKLIAQIRDLKSLPSLRILEPGDIVHFRIISCFKDGTQHTMQYATTHGPLHGRTDEEKKNIEDRLRQRLAEDIGVEFFREMELTMLGFLAERQYRLCLVEAAVLFEAWLKAFIKQQLLARGTSSENAKKIFLRNNGRPHDMTHIVEVTVKETLAFNFAATVECNDWRQKVRDIRNALVHGERTFVSEEEARDALKAIYAARKVIAANAA